MPDRKALARSLVHEVMNGRDLALLDVLCTLALGPKLRLAFAEFLAAFPDWQQEVIELIAEGSTVVARCRCRGTQLGEWDGSPASGRRMNVDEVIFFRFDGDRLEGMWSLEDTWTRKRQLAGDDVVLGELGSPTGSHGSFDPT